MADSSWISRLGGRRSLPVWAIVLAVVLFVSVNVIARGTLVGARIDLTADKLFTLSPGTLAVLEKIDEPITLRFYFSSQLARELPGLGKYASRVRNMLEEYEASAGGKIRLVEIDPVPFSDAEDEAVAFGLKGLPLDRTGEMVYFGLAGTNATDEQEVIPFFSPAREPFLEYDLTRVVQRLAEPDRTTIGLMSWLPVRGFPGSMMARMSAMGRPWQMLDQLEQLFAVQDVPTGAAEIPAGVDILMVIHPAGISDKTAYAIDQFLMRGGRALIFVDPLAEIAQRVPGANRKFVDTASDLKPLFDAWGLAYDKAKAAGDMLAAYRINAGTQQQPKPLEYPAWLRLEGQNFTGEDPITAQIDSMVMASAGAFDFKGGAGLDFRPLVRTSEQSMLLEAEDLKGQPDFEGIVERFKPTGRRMTLAARVSGPAPSAFPDGPPPLEAYLPGEDEEKDENGDTGSAESADAEGEAADPDKRKEAEALRAKLAGRHLARAAEPIHAVVFGDADMLRDRFWVQVQDVFGQTVQIPVSDNMNMVTNALDNLAGSEELIGLRSRGISQRPFTLVEDLKRQAELKLRAKERELQARREEVERKLARLQSPGRGAEDEGAIILSEAQAKEIRKFKAELLSIREQLRDVQLRLREDIEVLEARLWFFNIALVPLLVALAAVGLGLARMRRRRQRMETEARG